MMVKSEKNWWNQAPALMQAAERIRGTDELKRLFLCGWGMRHLPQKAAYLRNPRALQEIIMLYAEADRILENVPTELAIRWRAICLTRLGVVLHVLGRYNEALAQHKKAIELNLECAEAHYNLGNLYYDLEDYSQAQVHYSWTVEIDPDYSEAHFRLHQTFNNLHQYSESMIAFRNWRRSILRKDVERVRLHLEKLSAGLNQNSPAPSRA